LDRSEVIIPPTVIGYHGTSMSAASTIAHHGFKASMNDYDWLGDGVYFFQDAPQRAWEWARKIHGRNAAVIGATIEMRDWMDLLDIKWARFLAAAYDGFLSKMKEAGLPLPRQTAGGHRLDREVINYAVVILGENAQVVRAVRAAFSEGVPVFPNSALFDRSHVQIAVRDTGLITAHWTESERSP